MSQAGLHEPPASWDVGDKDVRFVEAYRVEPCCRKRTCAGAEERPAGTGSAVSDDCFWRTVTHLGRVYGDDLGATSWPRCKAAIIKAVYIPRGGAESILAALQSYHLVLQQHHTTTYQEPHFTYLVKIPN